MPALEQRTFLLLLNDLAELGPFRNNWPNFSKLGKNKFHCHLSWSWVVCWKHENKKIIIEVYYVDSCKNAPY